MEVKEIVFYSSHEIDYLKETINTKLLSCIGAWDSALTVNVIGVKQCERFKIEDFDDIKGIMFESESEMYLWVKTDVREVQTIASILVHSEKNIKATDLTQHLVNDFLIDISKVFSSRLQSSVSACDAENLRSVFSIQNGRAFRSGHLLVTLNINEKHS